MVYLIILKTGQLLFLTIPYEVLRRWQDLLKYRVEENIFMNTDNAIGIDSDIIILLPSDYYDSKNVDPSFSVEYQAICQIPEFKTILLNYDGFVTGDRIKIYPKDHYTGDCIYRGWMLKPQQYKELYEYLYDKNILLINNPEEYNNCHLFPYAFNHVYNYTPKSMCYEDGETIYWDVVNKTFKKFFIKDYVKSVKETNFPEYFETPVCAKEMNEKIIEFIKLRGDLYTGGIVLKEYVDLKKYGNSTNEYRAFYLDNQLLSLCRNSNQPDACSFVPYDFINKFNDFPSNFYTVDFAELSNGEWIVIETGDGQVSGLSTNQYALKFYNEMRRILLI